MVGSDIPFVNKSRVQKLRNRLRLRTQTRAESSFFIFVIFFAVFGVIILTEFMLLERPSNRTPVVSYLREELQTESMVAETDLPQPVTSPLDGVWQPVTGTRYRFYVFSAYVEKRTVAAVRIIAITRTKIPDKVFCRIWLPDNRTVTARAKVKIIREHWSLVYSAAYVLCLLRDSGVLPRETVGASVAVIASAFPSSAPTNLLTVLNTEPQNDIKDTIHVCVKPFHYSFGRDDWMIEWMEFNRLLGVTHFYMYNKSMSDTFTCTMNYYIKRGLVTLMSWKIPFVSKVEIRTEGQFATFNDCLYRSMARAGWLAPIDIDELIIPRKENTLVELLNNLTSSSHKHPARIPAGYLFRNAFFYLRWDDDPKAPVPIMTALKTRRKSSVNALKNRSKYVVRPRDAVELGNHFLWEHVPGATSVGVPADRGLLHHYRENCEYGGTDCLNAPSEVDRTAHKWSTQLMQRIAKVKEDLSKECHGAV